MDIKHLQTFLTAAETLNFTQTAKRLDYAQSSITAQIKSLEEELGIELFERLGKRLYLTVPGREFQLYAQKMVALHNEMIQQVTGLEEQYTTITIGAQESQCTYRLPTILAEFKKKYPQIQVIFKPVHTREIAQELIQNGELDFAIITDTFISLPTINLMPLVQEELIFAASPSTVHKVQSTEFLNDLSNQTLLLTEQGCSYRNQLENMLTTQNHYPKQVIEFVSIEAIKQCTIAGLGISYLPKMVVQQEVEKGTLTALTAGFQMEPIITQLAWHKDKKMMPHFKFFTELIRNYYNQLN
ncbi:LysR family transcriptional regulator [Lysinibacillus telephonicus]|uniref:LysR family transcriptional regulator n=1 Tax=Lysinibacillus telephonicus TaxID=1714840 RepID=A0A3S0JUD9_9BACI|nr:LysR family transcriptional regulator [Lysinibacillus telephonicus]RTQ91336.1 LysR family transcriptional regulator [Lysinibacillus telephonicus]